MVSLLSVWPCATQLTPGCSRRVTPADHAFTVCYVCTVSCQKGPHCMPWKHLFSSEAKFMKSFFFFLIEFHSSPDQMFSQSVYGQSFAYGQPIPALAYHCNVSAAQIIFFIPPPPVCCKVCLSEISALFFFFFHKPHRLLSLAIGSICNKNTLLEIYFCFPNSDCASLAPVKKYQYGMWHR